MNRGMDVVVQDFPPERIVWGAAKVAAGKVLVGVTEDGRLCRVSFLQGRPMADMAEQWQREWPRTRMVPGKIAKDFAKLPLLMVGTELQKDIWLEIMRIPYGEVRSYGEVADSMDLPGRARAVGRACRMCCLAEVVPCHRVVAASGLGGFGSDGTVFKEALLKREGVVLKGRGGAR